jgi:hypothetical protein
VDNTDEAFCDTGTVVATDGAGTEFGGVCCSVGLAVADFGGAVAVSTAASCVVIGTRVFEATFVRAGDDFSSPLSLARAIALAGVNVDADPGSSSSEGWRSLRRPSDRCAVAPRAPARESSDDEPPGAAVSRDASVEDVSAPVDPLAPDAELGDDDSVVPSSA